MKCTKTTAANILILLGAAMTLVFFVATVHTIMSGKAKSFIHRDTIIHGDGARLYSYLRSAWFDRNLNTENELNHYFNYPGSRERRDITRTPTGYAWNHTPVGCAVLWAPFFAAGHVVASGLHELGAPVRADGYSLPYSLTIALGTHCFFLLGMLCLFAVCCRFFPPYFSLLAVLTLSLASTLPAYSFLYPSMAHVHSFFTVSLFLLLWLRVRERGAIGQWLLLGVAGGVMMLVRTQNALFFILPIAWLIAGKEGGQSLGRRLSGFFIMLLFTVGVFSLQLYAWKVTHGSWLTIPQGEGFLHWGRPAVIRVLFSSRHGLFSWTPAALIGVAAFPLFIKKDRVPGYSLLAVFALQLYLNSVADDWWAGTGFGARRFANCVPIFALGMTALYKKITWKTVALIISLILITWNILFLAQYALNWVSHSEAIDMGEMIQNQWEMILLIVRTVRTV